MEFAVLPCVACQQEVRSESSFRCHRCKKPTHSRCGSLKNEECAQCEDKWLQRGCREFAMGLVFAGMLMVLLYNCIPWVIQMLEELRMEELRTALRRSEVQAEEALDVFNSACLSQEGRKRSL